MARFKTTSLADQVYAKLEQDIVMGVYPRGQILTELKLVEQLGVSRTPIREALRRLEQDRLIEESGKGSVVLGITKEDLEDIMEIRRSVEPLASYYAACNATDAELEELKHLVELQEFYCQKEDMEHLSQTDGQFHGLICTAGKHNVIRDTLLPLHRKIARFRRAALEQKRYDRHMVSEHRRIYEAIAAGKAEESAKQTAIHLTQAQGRLTERNESLWEEPSHRRSSQSTWFPGR